MILCLLKKYKNVFLFAGIFVLAKILDIDIPFILFGLSLVDNFDSYTDGDLNGQGSWSGSTDYDVQTSVVHSGSKAVSISSPGNYKVIDKSITSANSGIQSFYFRATATGIYATFLLRENSTDIFALSMGQTGNEGKFMLYVGSTPTLTQVGTFSVNTWYQIEIEWKSDSQCRVRIDGGTWSSWYDAWHDFSSGINDVRMGGYHNGTSYYDDFSDPNAGTEKSVSDIGAGLDNILRNKQFTLSEIGIGTELISTSKTFIITDSGNGVDGVLKGLSLTITDYGLGVDSVDRVIATDIDIQEWGAGVDEVETSISAEEREHRKNYHITVYRADGSFIKVWNDANFIGFRKYINGGLGDCTLSLARKFDNYGEYDDVKLNNEIRISITDEDTITSDESEKLIYTGYISKYEPFIDGGKEGVVVTCLGYYTKFAQDIYKNGTTTTITESATDVGTMFKNLMDRFRAETSTPKLFYTGGSIETTGTTASYTFEMMTYREAIDIIKRLAPTNWWWYVDQNHLVKFKSKPSSVTHTFVFGRHFKSVHIEKGMEKIKNAVLFWNQVTGVGQVYRLYKDTVSISDFGRRISKYFDPNRVGGTIDATKIADGLIDEHKDPDIKVKVEIIDNNYSTKGYDIESIEPGDTCSFVGFSDSLNETFKEGMIITEVEYHLDRVMLTIEPLQASIVDRIEEVARGLSSINSKDAPSAYNE